VGEATEKLPVKYLSYLLRLSGVSDPGQGAVWRANVERVHDGQQLSFATLDELFDFLRQETGSESGLHSQSCRGGCSDRVPIKDVQ
jgi:hypothetical protein